jgi:hypothetical protein
VIKVTNFVPAPANGRKDRTTVGVGELTFVEITNSHLGNPKWQVANNSTAGVILPTKENRRKNPNWHNAVFCAKTETSNASYCTITAVFPYNNLEISKDFSIKEPSSEKGIKMTTDAECLEIGLSPISTFFSIAGRNPSMSGAYLPLRVEVLPNDVSFSNVEARELGAPDYIKDSMPINMTPYFINGLAYGVDFKHYHGKGWIALDAGCNGWIDNASFFGFPPPWYSTAQSFEWHIPVEWRVNVKYEKFGYISSAKKFLQKRIQKISILDTTGRSKVEKLNQSAERTPTP